MESKNSQVAVADGGQATASSLEAPRYYVPKWTVDGSGLIGGWGIVNASREGLVEEVGKSRRLVVLNAVVAPPGPMFMFYEPVDVEIAVEVLRRANIESFIGHESTAKLLSELSGRNIPFNRAVYIPQRGDIALIVRLRGGSRMASAPDVKDLTPDMLEFALLWYL
jgi:hypothetical protein